ncbi:uncharacterized protein GGS25DRAFT_525844 [Hypoxylon fragiforme]|uniref:uncharacterized protein n=1 Tax=Hypoxylon fragiforme TaxID=63214 RepID=UPI0020C68A88|nr:uncharacterized protein GGS25DRAFT_525844 [Hypoxylon fragiforme]KAI2604553.1 hypothetical protein GGS25DRAFT_525844 [Hypoxylon fragiforme]
MQQQSTHQTTGLNESLSHWLRGTWGPELTPSVADSWQLAASELGRSTLQFRQERIDEGVVMRSPGDAIYHPRLPCQVAHTTSLWQMLWQMRREAYELTQ